MKKAFDCSVKYSLKCSSEWKKRIFKEKTDDYYTKKSDYVILNYFRIFTLNCFLTLKTISANLQCDNTTSREQKCMSCTVLQIICLQPLQTVQRAITFSYNLAIVRTRYEFQRKCLLTCCFYYFEQKNIKFICIYHFSWNPQISLKHYHWVVKIESPSEFINSIFWKFLTVLPNVPL